MLDLNARVHLHEEMLIAIDNTFKRRDRIKTYRFTKASSLLLHCIKGLHVLRKHCGLTRSAGLLGALSRSLK